MTSAQGDNWDEHLEAVLFGIRTSVQQSTKYTPFFLMHGREARLPSEVDGLNPIQIPSQPPDVTSIIAHLARIKEEVFPVAESNIKQAQKKQKEQYRRRKGITKPGFKVGDVVLRMNMLKRTKKGHKMEDTWLGPYKVIEVTDYGCCQLQCLISHSILKHKVNCCQLKHYEGHIVDYKVSKFCLI